MIHIICILVNAGGSMASPDDFNSTLAECKHTV